MTPVWLGISKMNTLFLWACSFTRLSFCTLFLYERQKLLCLHVHMTLQPCYAIESTFKAINWISPYWWHSQSSGHNMGGVAQMVERSLSMREVPGSIPGASKFFLTVHHRLLVGKLLQKNKKIVCIVRESNPGRPRGRRAFYH